MQRSFAQRLGNLAGFITLLILTALTGWLTWLSWHQYRDEHRYGQISSEGQHVSVRISAIDRSSRSWTDQFTNTVYLSFHHQHKTYRLRYHQDSGWLNSGDQVDLLYHAGFDEFRQPRSHSFFRSNLQQSRLVGFTIVSSWNDERKWLIGCIILAAVFLMLASTLLARLTGIQRLRFIGQLAFIGLLLTGVAYFTYNTWQYYQYHSQLKRGGHEETVQVQATSRKALSKRSSWFYTYEATVVHNKEERLIAIDGSEFDILKPGDPLQVYYNPGLNDMMSVNHEPDSTNLIATGFVWVLLIFFTWQQWSRWKKGN